MGATGGGGGGMGRGVFKGVGQRMSGGNYRQLSRCCQLALQIPNNTIKG